MIFARSHMASARVWRVLRVLRVCHAAEPSRACQRACLGAFRCASAALGVCAGSAVVTGCTTDATIAARQSPAEVPAAGSAALTNGSHGNNGSNSSGVLLETPKSSPVALSTGTNGCVAGHYLGTFNGIYNSAAWGNGSYPLSIEAVSSNGQPGLEFWLEATQANCDSDAEFCADFTVTGGKIRGFANPFSDTDRSDGDSEPGSEGVAIAVRFEIDFGGDLDCSSGQFRGLLQNGCYDVATILFRFEGSAPATYNYATTSFENGEWSVKELPNPEALVAPDPSIGGMGSWDAMLVSDNTRPADAGAGLCHD